MQLLIFEILIKRVLSQEANELKEVQFTKS